MLPNNKVCSTAAFFRANQTARNCGNTNFPGLSRGNLGLRRLAANSSQKRPHASTLSGPGKFGGHAQLNGGAPTVQFRARYSRQRVECLPQACAELLR